MKKRLVLKLLLIGSLCLLLTGIAGVNLYAAGDCPSDAICRDDSPGNFDIRGPYGSKSYVLRLYPGATVYYPRTAQPPFAGLVYCPPLTGMQYMLAAWGPFFASHGIVLVTMDTMTIMDYVESRATQQSQVLNLLKRENTRAGSPLNGKLDVNRIGAMGWSMGGGATWINSGKYAGLKTAMTLAGHNMSVYVPTNIPYAQGSRTTIPLLIMNGATDLTILGGMGQSDGVYRNAKGPKIIYVVATAGHFDWMAPTGVTLGEGVKRLALAFQKTFLDGDTRWQEYLKQRPTNASKFQTANF